MNGFSFDYDFDEIENELKNRCNGDKTLEREFHSIIKNIQTGKKDEKKLGKNLFAVATQRLTISYRREIGKITITNISYSQPKN